MPASWNFFRRQRSRADADALRLLDVVNQVARRPAFFGTGRVPDTLDGRLEVLMLHGALILIRLNEAPELAPLAQPFVDGLFRLVDSGLREAAVGDTAVPKRMKKIAGDFYGRLSAYQAALAGGDLCPVVGRNVLGDEQAAFAQALSRHAAVTASALAEAPVEALFDLSTWPAGPA